MKRKTAIWGLKSRVPPPTPAVSLPKSGVINNDVLDSFNSTVRKMKPVTKINNKLQSPDSCRVAVPVKRLRKSSSQDSDAVSSVEAPAKCVPRPVEPPPLLAVEEEPKVPPAPPTKKKKERRKLPFRVAKSQKPSGLIYKKVVLPPRRPVPVVDIADSDDTTSSHDTLNSIIPHPTNFEGLNNPFTANYQPASSCGSSTTSSRSSSSNSSVASSTSSSSSKRKPEQRSSQPQQPRHSPRLRPARKSAAKEEESESVIDHLLNDPRTDCGAGGEPVQAEPGPPSNAAVSDYFGLEDRISSGERFTVLAKRTTPDGKVQYLIEWDSVGSP